MTGTTTSVSSVEVTTPPMIARPIGACVSPLSPKPSASGNMPKIIAAVVTLLGVFTGLVGATYPEGSKLFVPFLKNFMALPINSTIDLRQFNTTNDPNGNIYLGLAYTIIVALMTVVVGTLFLREPKGVKIWQEVGGEEPGMVTEATPAE